MAENSFSQEVTLATTLTIQHLVDAAASVITHRPSTPARQHIMQQAMSGAAVATGWQPRH
jgi:hypothetical protein